MNLLYEEEGDFKVGAVLAHAPASFQVESPHGKRSKVKAAQVLLNFERPSGAELLAGAGHFAKDLDTDFLWQFSPEAEFGFQDLARDYVGREPTPTESAGVLMKLHAAPMYFYRRGRGRYQKAPEATLKLALAGAEKKRRQLETIAQWAAQLQRFECPPEIARLRDDLLYAPDRNKPETKALEQACAASGLAAPQLFERCGLLASAHDYHLNRFLHEIFPAGAGYAAHEAPAMPPNLPLAEVRAFSLDDSDTTEIDDAFSVTCVSEDELRIGIHIAAPALCFTLGSSLDAIARDRLSSAYLPDRKFTMLPEDAIAIYSLDAGEERPAVSLYLNVSAADGTVRGHHTRLERVRVAANLRHQAYGALNEGFESGAACGLPYEDELRQLWRMALALKARRGRPSTSVHAVDYTFRVEAGRVSIETRRRGAPLDKLVAELMILANSTWGELLAERDVAAIYRAQAVGKVRLSVHPEAHEGLGVSCYAWLTSPLRRYVDLLNQWQLAAAVQGRRAPLSRSSEALLTAMRAFELTAARLDEHQRALEQFWCLRWLQQEALAESEAVVLRENLVRFERLPLVTRVPSLPGLEAGTRVRLAIDAVDLLERSVACTWRETLPAAIEDARGPGA
ncbi:MAG: RNB domain-containing ribonuclease [Betaproteobacteria bacterium]|nr:RNB domain-containing ribonuclease [Betaproteobacteria bacterium]